MTVAPRTVKRAHDVYTEEYVDCDILCVKSDTRPRKVFCKKGRRMPQYNKRFELSIHDVDLIEESLRARARELCKMRRALSEQNPADLQSITVIEADQRENEELLGRLHNQKIFYRPGAAPYIGGLFSP